MFSVKKQPNERFCVGVDFADVLASDEALAISGSSVLVVDRGGNDVTNELVVSNSLAVNGAILQAVIEGGGVSDRRYTISFLAGTSNGYRYGHDMRIVITDT